MDAQELQDRHLTDGAQYILSDIAERALHRGQIRGELTEATAGMLGVLSVLRCEGKVAFVVLEWLGTDLDRLARDLDLAIAAEGQSSGPGGDTPPVLIVDLESPCQSLTEQAVGESRARGRKYVGSEHVLLAAVRFAGPRLRGVLDRHAVTYDRIDQAIADIIGLEDR